MYQIENFIKRIYGERFSGEFSSNEKGDGYDLEDFREYQIGDNIKKINWKLSAKYDKEYISIYRQEKEPILDIFIDLNQNFLIFKNEFENYLNLLSLLFKQLGIKKNIYVLKTRKLLFKKRLNIEKINNFDNLSYKNISVSSINELVKLDEFKTKHYKLIISDFSFLNKNTITNFAQFYNKIFFSILPIYDILNKSSFPILNGYFDSFLNKDFINDYKMILDSLSQYGETEKIFNL